MKIMQIVLITTSILASSVLLADDVVPATGETTSKTIPYGDNPSLGRVLLYKTGKGIEKIGNSIQRGSDKASVKVQQKWENTKEFTAEKAEIVQQKADSAKNFTEEKLQQAKQNITSSRNGENVPIVQGELSNSSTSPNAIPQ